MTEDVLRDVDKIKSGGDELKDFVEAKYLKIINSVSFDDLTIYTVELPLSEHKRPEVKLAKKGEIQNLMDYDVFEEVPDVGQDCIGSTWVITAKEKHDGQKQRTTMRLVAQGFQETLKPQSDSTMASKVHSSYSWLLQPMMTSSLPRLIYVQLFFSQEPWIKMSSSNLPMMSESQE